MSSNNPSNSRAIQNRRSSRANSTSSSVVTVKKSASLSSRSGLRGPLAKGRPLSPDLPGSASNGSLTSRSRSQSRPTSVADNTVNSPNLNINRWSHSTSSSTSAIDTDLIRKRTSSSARRSSTGLTYGANMSHAAQEDSIADPRRTAKQQGLQVNTAVNHQSVLAGPSPNRDRTPTANQQVRYATGNGVPPTPVMGPPASRGLPQDSSSLLPDDHSGEIGDSWEMNGKYNEPTQGISSRYSTTSPQKNRAEPRSRVDFMSSSDSRRMYDGPQALRSGNATRRDRSTSGSADVGPSSSASSVRSEYSRARGHRSPTQKTMLSKALSKANTAVLLDNAQNINAAIEAYAEACDLLQQVMERSSDPEDRKKLSAIRGTYSNRIAELHDLDDSFLDLMDKALPDDPPSDETDTSRSSSIDVGDDRSQISSHPASGLVLKIPLRQESLLPQIFGGETYLHDPLPSARTLPLKTSNLTAPMEAKYMPPPLSPRPLPSPSLDSTATPIGNAPPRHALKTDHSRDGSSESTSWLDTLDESASSGSSSRLSSVDFGGQGPHALADEMEAEFDAAMSAAVDAAYSHEPRGQATPRQRGKPDNEAEAIIPDRQSETPRPVPPPVPSFTNKTFQPGISSIRPADSQADRETQLTRDYADSEAEEEERLLDEMTRGYVFDDFNFDQHSKSALPRQSDSSGFSGRTWGSSTTSTTMTNGTTLSTLAEALESSSQSPPLSQRAASGLSASMLSHSPESHVPRLPSLQPPLPGPRPSSFEKQLGPGIRDRRLSGQSARQLKIETYKRPDSITTAPHSQPTAAPGPALGLAAQNDPRSFPTSAPPTQSAFAPLPTNMAASQPYTPLTSIHSGDSLKSMSPATPALTQGGSLVSMEESMGIAPSPSRFTKMMPPPPVIRRNLSSSSLRLGIMAANSSEPTESPITPGSAALSAHGRRGNSISAGAMLTPNAANLVSGMTGGGMFLFDDHLGTPMTPDAPQSPDALVTDSAPEPLEPCPEPFLLRPFWLMRCLYQTIAHPRGGYISTKLFIPRDIWRVKNVKLKVLEDKVSQCDMLTAALQKLGEVDPLDADAVLEELQSFELVLEHVRTSLQKKLGSDVGLASSSNVFRPSAVSEEASDAHAARASNSSAAKSFASGWRKLRSKSSSAALNGSFPAGPRDLPATSGPMLTMATLPMSSALALPSARSHYNNRIRAPPPTPSRLTNISPLHAAYMSSLARLFDAVQVLDSIACQVEDPGLKCSSKTHVGLELSVRNAAEFFAFFVVRFVMADLALLVDKFLKRGSEWVLT